MLAQESLNKSGRRRLINSAERITYAEKLGQIALELGQDLQKTPASAIYDTLQVRGHQFSTLDQKAETGLRTLAEQRLEGVPTILEESNIPAGKLSEALEYPLLVVDAVEGSTNAKRQLGSALNVYGHRPIQAGTALMLLESPKLGSIAATAFYDWASGRVITCFRGEQGSFVTCIDGKVVSPYRAQEPPRDSQRYAIVPGYSNANIQCRADIEIALSNHDIWSSGGSRSSAQDILNLLWGHSDAYLDLRCLFPGGKTCSRGDEVLRAWDVGPLLAALDGVGFIITNPLKKSWQEFCFGDSLSLIVARDGQLWQTINEAVGSLPFICENGEQESTIVSFSSLQPTRTGEGS